MGKLHESKSYNIELKCRSKITHGWKNVLDWNFNVYYFSTSIVFGNLPIRLVDVHHSCINSLSSGFPIHFTWRWLYIQQIRNVVKHFFFFFQTMVHQVTCVELRLSCSCLYFDCFRYFCFAIQASFWLSYANWSFLLS